MGNSVKRRFRQLRTAAACAQTAWVKGVSKLRARAIVNLMRSNFLSVRSCFVIALALAATFTGAVQAQLPEPAILLTIKATDLFRDKTSADRNYGVHFHLYSYAQVAENDPVAAERADVYVGLLRPDGVPMTWANDPKPYGYWLPVSGMQPLARNLPLSGGFTNVKLVPGGGYLYHVFKPEDLPGIYQWFTLVVRAGKPVDDTTQWLAMRTVMIPVK